MMNINIKEYSKNLFINSDKCIKFAKELMKENKNLVIDKTNPTVEERKIYIDLAKQNGNSSYLPLPSTNKLKT
jgi:predicted kinase